MKANKYSLISNSILYLNSIEPLNPESIAKTNERPVIVHCADLNDYYVKYHKNVGQAKRLFNEYLLACMLPIWGLNCSTYAFIKVLPKHLPDNLGIDKRHFNSTCFGVRIIEDCFDLTEVNIGILKKSTNKTEIKNDIFKISFLDILMCNEDRHFGNLNIICKREQYGYSLYPIDHIAIFNQLGLEHDLTELTFDETLINTKLFSKMLYNKDLPKKRKLKTMRESFYLCFQDCKNNLDICFENVPLDWGINKAEVKTKLLALCFNDIWFNQCWTIFIHYLQLFQNKIKNKGSVNSV